MAKMALNKSSLTKERTNLRLYQRLLPSLELKRQQLMGELARARGELSQIREELEIFESGIADQIPMMADREIDVGGLVKIKSVEIGEVSVVGVRVPVLSELNTTVADYSFLAKPHWVDALVDRLHQTTELRLKVQVAEEKVRRLEVAVRRTTQRVNLFDKIMIPAAKKNIKRIMIYLGDLERSAVVRSKLAKKKRLAERQVMIGSGDAT
ncbi:MAG: V-type ATP synthase subunit D [bacterium]|nr:V-type ATP synthase subunit D [bacterium]